MIRPYALAAGALFLAAAAAPAAAQPFLPPDVVGAWSCTGQNPEFTVEYQIDYADDGSYSNRLAMSGQAEGSELAFALAIVGRWTLEEGVLSETIDSAAVDSFTINGSEIDDPQIAQGFAAGVSGQTMRNQIVSLDDGLMVLNADGEQIVNCRR